MLGPKIELIKLKHMCYRKDFSTVYQLPGLYNNILNVYITMYGVIICMRVRKFYKPRIWIFSGYKIYYI